LNTTPDNSVMKDIKLNGNNEDEDQCENINSDKKIDNHSSINLQKFKSFKSQQSKRESGRES